METHSCIRSYERGIAAVSWAGTYRLGIVEQDNVNPDKVDHRGIPILQHGQTHQSLGHFGMSYSKEQREYYRATACVIKRPGEVEANPPQDFLPGQAYFIWAMVRT